MTTEPSASAQTNPLVLLVDDDEDSRFLYTHYLVSAAGLRVEEASNGRDAVEMARALAPAVIVMDLTLPVMDGWEALRLLKGDPQTRAIPVVALTGYTIPKAEQRESGFAAFLQKPCLPEVLATECARLLVAARP